MAAYRVPDLLGYVNNTGRAAYQVVRCHLVLTVIGRIT